MKVKMDDGDDSEHLLAAWEEFRLSEHIMQEEDKVEDQVG